MLTHQIYTKHRHGRSVIAFIEPVWLKPSTWEILLLQLEVVSYFEILLDVEFPRAYSTQHLCKMHRVLLSVTLKRRKLIANERSLLRRALSK